MNVLFMVTHINSANGVCVKNVATQLLHEGEKVFVLTQYDSLNESDTTDKGYKVYTITPTIVQKVQLKISLFNKKVFARILQMLHRIWCLLCYPCWPLTSPCSANKMFIKAKKVILSENIDVVVPIYNSIETLITGYKLKKLYDRLIYIPYFLDALYGGQIPRFMSKRIQQKKASRWEKKLLCIADGIIMMESARKSYEEINPPPEYLKKVTFLDIPMLKTDLLVKEKNNRLSKDEIVFLFAGSLPRNIRSPKVLLSLFSSIDNPNWRLFFIGTNDYERLISEAVKHDSRIKCFGKVPHNQAIEMMMSADYLINLGNTLPYMVPSKIFEYMSFNKPIISTYKFEKDPCLRYLKLYKKAVLINENEDMKKNRNILECFIDNVENNYYEDSDVIELIKPGKLLYNNTPTAFVKYLNKYKIDT